MDQNILRRAIYEYVKNTGIKKSFIAASIDETPNNFSRWLIGKRNYNQEREKKLINFLIDRGVDLNDKKYLDG